ncbi:DUF3078 domain-containing protein [Puteibacter caeruleilacunae]|nr:DUF3078 domain-containing protein [Puteibacter caeruleilacunae]
MKSVNLLVTLLLCIFCYSAFAGEPEMGVKKKKEKTDLQVEKDSIQTVLQKMNQFMDEEKGWYFPKRELERSVKTLTSHVEATPIDSLFVRLLKVYMGGETQWISRDVSDLTEIDTIPGVITSYELDEKMRRIDRAVRNSFYDSLIVVPPALFQNIEGKIDLLPEEQGEMLIATGYKQLPERFKRLPEPTGNKQQDSLKVINFQADRIAFVDSLRRSYNDSLIFAYRDSISADYREKVVTYYSDSIQTAFKDSIDFYNLNLVTQWNDSIVEQANREINDYVGLLTEYALNDSVQVNIQNLSNQQTSLLLNNNGGRYTRLWLKNEQNDSLSVKIENVNNRSMKILIDDGVTISRFKEQQTKDFAFNVKKTKKNLNKVNRKLDVYTPWKVGGYGNAGFTQTYINDYWSKGGKSSLSILAVLKGYANYLKPKLKWENNAEIKNGWMWIDEDDAEVRKNSDRFYIASRLGISAFKKWYYSAESNFETQFFNGYKYPNTDNKISAFLAPAKWQVKIGLDYKPNKNMSLLLSPLTSKTVWVRKSSGVDPTRFGTKDKDTYRLWVPGFSADWKYKKQISPDASWTTKLKVLFDYRDPIAKRDIDWENIVLMQLTQRVNLNFNTKLIYDDNVKFATGKKDADGKDIKKPKWQFKEFVTIGFSYKFDRQLYKNVKDIKFR